VSEEHADHDPLVDELRTLFSQADPVPALVTETAKAALGWRRLDAELAELLGDSALDAGALALARGAGATLRSASFSAGEVTIDVEFHIDGAERTVLGQLSPPTAARIEVQAANESASSTTESDGLGRFRTQLPAGGSIRLRVTIGDADGARLIETSWIAL
jgi:hypothetical protein